MKLGHHASLPLVSAIVCSYEGDAHLLSRALRSIVAQDLPHDLFEIVVVTDGEPVEAHHAACEEVLGDSDIGSLLLWTKEPTGYYCIPRNQATRASNGIYIANLDADNEWRPNHLSGLLDALRVPDREGFPHFAYSRREYVNDGITHPKFELPVGPTELVPWTVETLGYLVKVENFIDASDFLISRSLLYELEERTEWIWNEGIARMADWDLMKRLAFNGARGKPVDQVTSVYHWTGKNVQLTRPMRPVDTKTYDPFKGAGA